MNGVVLFTPISVRQWMRLACCHSQGVLIFQWSGVAFDLCIQTVHTHYSRRTPIQAEQA
ncbi:hypothetical protein [Neptuniibacter pectenicola]|uniref:hypothetical protein n=1 Tax=Neptuniibacter pectenicola TaxID=1806669 RepID=UPI0012E82AD6|nr:hypothetical protein [Neptuniibacter pectenicola]